MRKCETICKKTIDALNEQLDEISLVANNALANAEKLEAEVTALEAENKLLKANKTKRSSVL